jgi:hypothetical protein
MHFGFGDLVGVSLEELGFSVNRPDGSGVAVINASLRYSTCYRKMIFLVQHARSEMMLWYYD